MKLNYPPILFGEVWDLVSCDVSCIHVLCVWIRLNLAVKFRNYLILTQLPVFSDSSLLSSPIPDSYRIVLCPVNSHKCVGCMLINFSEYIESGSSMYHLKSIFFYQKLVSLGEFEEDLLVQSCLNWWACGGKRPEVLGRLLPVPASSVQGHRPASDPQRAPVSEGGWISCPPAFLLHVLWQIQSCLILLFYGFFRSLTTGRWAIIVSKASFTRLHALDINIVTSRISKTYKVVKSSQSTWVIEWSI